MCVKINYLRLYYGRLHVKSLHDILEHNSNIITCLHINTKSHPWERDIFTISLQLLVCRKFNG